MQRTLLITLASLALVVTAGVALASSIPGPDGVIHGCYQERTGVLRLVDPSAACHSDELSVSWNQQGPKGATGPTGPVGATGATGPQGPAGGALAGYEVVTVEAPATRGVVTLEATCSSGKIPISGGWDVLIPENGNQQIVIASRPAGPISAPTGWYVSVFDRYQGVRVYALCVGAP